MPNYLAVFWPALKTWPYNSIGGIVTIVVLVIINVIGIKEAARLNIILALLDLGTQVLLMVVGVVLLLEPKLLIDQVHLGVAPTWSQLIYGISIGTIAYTGIETISNMAEEAANPDRDVPGPSTTCWSPCSSSTSASRMTALSAMPVEAQRAARRPRDRQDRARRRSSPKSEDEPNGPFVFEGAPPPGNVGGDVYVPRGASRASSGSSRPQSPGDETFSAGRRASTRSSTARMLGSVYQEDPVVGIVRFLPDDLGWLKAILMPWVGILAATILLIATNAGLIGVSRLAYSLGQHRQVPPLLGRVHPRRLTPYIAIIVFGGVACVLLLLPGNTIACWPTCTPSAP